jgi:hypothetical protein
VSPQYPRFARVTESVKRFRPSDLLPVLAEVADEIDQPDPGSNWRASVARLKLVDGWREAGSRRLSWSS